VPNGTSATRGGTKYRVNEKGTGSKDKALVLDSPRGSKKRSRDQAKKTKKNLQRKEKKRQASGGDYAVPYP